MNHTETITLMTERDVLIRLRDDLTTRIKRVELRLQQAGITDTAIAAIRLDIINIDEELSEALADSDSLLNRNRRAIDIHGKLQRVTADLERLIDLPGANEVRQLLAGVMDRLLKEVFNIDPDEVDAKPPAAKVAKKVGTKKAVAKKASARKTRSRV